MTAISHHIPDPLLIAYANGQLPYHSALVIATHVSLDPDARAALTAHEMAGGAIMEHMQGVDMSAGALDRMLAQLDNAQPNHKDIAPRIGSGIYPAPLIDAMGGPAPKWRTMGMGSRQQILHQDNAGSVRLLYIPAGQAVPDHGHEGLEMTLVLQGAFKDETGRYGVGDVQVADDDLDHTPIAEPGIDCICLASNDGKLRFNNWFLKLLQPVLRI